MNFLENFNDGQIHSVISLALAVPCTIIGLGLDGIRGAILMGGGCVAGIFLSPDLDQETLTTSETIFLKIPYVGWVFTGLMFAYWLGYAVMFKHRGISHWPVVGTITRMMYISFTFVIILVLWHVNLFTIVLPYFPLWFLGLCISDVGHYLRDWVGSGFRL